MNFTYTFNAGDSALTALLALLPFILAGVLLGTLTHKLAVKKGYKGYFWTGFFWTVVGLIYVVGLPVKTTIPAPQNTEKAE